MVICESVIDDIMRVCSKPKEEVEDTPPVDETNDELSSVANVCDAEKYQEVFQARHKLCKLIVLLLLLGELVGDVLSWQYHLCSVMLSYNRGSNIWGFFQRGNFICYVAVGATNWQTRADLP